MNLTLHLTEENFDETVQFPGGEVNFRSNLSLDNGRLVGSVGAKFIVPSVQPLYTDRDLDIYMLSFIHQQGRNVKMQEKSTYNIEYYYNIYVDEPTLEQVQDKLLVYVEEFTKQYKNLCELNLHEIKNKIKEKCG